MCETHARLMSARWRAHTETCRIRGVCVRCQEPIEPWRSADACTVCTQALTTERRQRGAASSVKLAECKRCGRHGHYEQACCLPPHDWEGPISATLNQSHSALTAERRAVIQSERDELVGRVRRLEWILENDREIVITRRDTPSERISARWSDGEKPGQ